MRQTRAYRPTRLGLPSGRVMAIDPAGVAGDGRLQVPDDPARAGWWTGGALVGEPFGSVVVAGHVDSLAYGVGAMSELVRVAVGDRVEIGDAGTTWAYEVVAVAQVAKADLRSGAEAFRQDVAHRLVLLTCAGRYDRAAGAYPDNLVVVAEPVGITVGIVGGPS